MRIVDSSDDLEYLLCKNLLTSTRLDGDLFRVMFRMSLSHRLISRFQILSVTFKMWFHTCVRTFYYN